MSEFLYFCLHLIQSVGTAHHSYSSKWVLIASVSQLSKSESTVFAKILLFTQCCYSPRLQVSFYYLIPFSLVLFLCLTYCQTALNLLPPVNSCMIY